MLCCGEFHQTNFCPGCGKQLAFNNPLVGLLVHVRNQYKGKVKKRQATERLHRAGSKRWKQQHVEHDRKLEEKWRSWDEELTRVLLEWQAKQPDDKKDPEIARYTSEDDEPETPYYNKLIDEIAGTLPDEP